jgi:hypothetical protein
MKRAWIAYLYAISSDHQTQRGAELVITFATLFAITERNVTACWNGAIPCRYIRVTDREFVAEHFLVRPAE